ncbi:HTH-type transcriptional regulator TnrA [Bacillus sp. THAF10]|uniref:MerR family transcriptional regulator n=1 Tax=Bacillus sp. THAF10 TaxID=2587848 RepID=UPI0012697D16|nr:MerR family transcriptional regulator [Bacillus sp. THAF10]QFT89269.1 HTH-type transcriptional regulator TnrA [Bacillus sp. THAF10]
MSQEETPLKDRKVISIGTVRDLTGLSERQIRYYEERKLIFPARNGSGIRKYSFADVERLMEIANQMEEGVQTHEIRREWKKKEKEHENWKKQMLKGQIQAHFKQNRP